MGVVSLIVALTGLLFCITATTNATSVTGSTLLNSYPFIMSHDSASGEIVEDRDFVLADWTKTQSVGIVGQLDCGSRSFDYRPYVDGDKIIAHHGGVKIHKTMESTLLEIHNWSKSNPNDLVVLYISHIDGDSDGQSSVTALLKKLNIYTIEDCSVLSSLTYAQAVKNSLKVPSTTKVMAIFDCTNENYDDKINCYGKDFTCYDSWPENTASIPWGHFNSYIQNTTQANPITKKNSLLWMTQAHWQSSAASVTLGTAHRSSIVKDEELSGVNKQMETQILEGKLKYLNFLELDNVCDNGVQVYDAIRKTYL